MPQGGRRCSEIAAGRGPAHPRTEASPPAGGDPGRRRSATWTTFDRKGAEPPDFVRTAVSAVRDRTQFQTSKRRVALSAKATTDDEHNGTEHQATQLRRGEPSNLNRVDA